jgi:hypothetical protein
MAPLTTSPQHPSSTLVNISSDADLRLIRLLAPHCSKSFESTCSTAISAGDASKLLRTILDDERAIPEIITGNYILEEAVGIYSLFGALLERVGGSEDQKKLCAGLTEAVVKTLPVNGNHDDSDGAKEKRSGMLAALFNTRSDGIEKIRILSHIVEMADVEALAPGVGVSSLSDLLEPTALEASMNVWGENIPDVEKRGLFRAVVKGMDSLMEKLRSERGDTMAEGVEAEVSAADKNIRDVEDRKQTYLLLILDTYKDEVRLFMACYVPRLLWSVFYYERRAFLYWTTSQIYQSHHVLTFTLVITPNSNSHQWTKKH